MPKRRVLVVEDDPDARALLETILSDEGHEVLTAPHGEAGLALLRAERPDAVFLDLMMPVLDGWHVLRAWRADPDPAVRAIPVIVVTASNQLGPPLADLAPTATVAKPYHLEDILAVLDRVLGHREPAA